MPKEISPSYGCDCGLQSHFSENTIRGINAMSRKKKVRLLDSATDEHTIVFYRGEMVDIITHTTSFFKPRLLSASQG